MKATSSSVDREGSLGPLARAETRRFRIALANLDETPGVTLEGLGFTGFELRRSFELAARMLPVDMVYFDNAGDPARAVAVRTSRGGADRFRAATDAGRVSRSGLRAPRSPRLGWLA